MQKGWDGKKGGSIFLRTSAKGVPGAMADKWSGLWPLVKLAKVNGPRQAVQSMRGVGGISQTKGIKLRIFNPAPLLARMSAMLTFIFR